MIAYYMEFPSQNGRRKPGNSRSRVTHKTLPVPCVYTGTLRTTKNGRRIVLKDGTRLFKATVFDDSCVPPMLVREDYNTDELRKLGAALPEFYGRDGSIVRGSDGETVM